MSCLFNVAGVMRCIFLIVCACSISTGEPIRMEKRGIPSADLDRLKLFGQYSAAAYCQVNINRPNTKITCPQANNCATVEAATTTTILKFKDLFGTTGFVATDRSNKNIIIAFRGARSPANIRTIGAFPLLEDIDMCSGCKVMPGFWLAWTAVSNEVQTAVKSALAINPDYQVVATGHSLGGALANLAAGTLRKNGTIVDLYAYGAQRTGNQAFTNFISKAAKGKTFRVTHLDDPPPCMLPSSITDFSQISPEYYIKSGNSGVSTVDDVERLEGSAIHCTDFGEDLEFLFASGVSHVEAHRFYFGAIDACQ